MSDKDIPRLQNTVPYPPPDRNKSSVLHSPSTTNFQTRATNRSDSDERYTPPSYPLQQEPATTPSLNVRWPHPIPKSAHPKTTPSDPLESGSQYSHDVFHHQICPSGIPIRQGCQHSGEGLAEPERCPLERVCVREGGAGEGELLQRSAGFRGL